MPTAVIFHLFGILVPSTSLDKQGAISHELSGARAFAYDPYFKYLAPRDVDHFTQPLASFRYWYFGQVGTVNNCRSFVHRYIELKAKANPQIRLTRWDDQEASLKFRTASNVLSTE